MKVNIFLDSIQIEVQVWGRHIKEFVTKFSDVFPGIEVETILNDGYAYLRWEGERYRLELFDHTKLTIIGPLNHKMNIKPLIGQHVYRVQEIKGNEIFSDKSWCGKCGKVGYGNEPGEFTCKKCEVKHG